MAYPSIDQQITFLYTRDLVATARFYEEVMGLELKLDQGTCRIYQVSRDGYVGFCLRDDAPAGASDPGTRHVILTLVTDQVDDWYRYLGKQGVALEKPPAVNPRYNIYHCTLRDPNGYLIEIQRFLHPF
jgi:catechol 2,3-dioxygenase-like lactoylglutathione lyase family enzyme